MIETLFALALLCSTPGADAAVAPAHEDFDIHYEFEWAGRGMPAAPTRSDTTIQVERGLKLVLQGMNGDIQVVTWPKPLLRVQAEHARQDRLVFRRKGRELRLEAERSMGVPEHVDWRLTVPEWMPLNLSCLEGDVNLEGTRGAVEVSALRGDVLVQSSSGPLTLNSVEGQVTVLDTKGRVSASSINNDVHLTRIVGPIDAQSVNGSIRMEHLQALNVAASSVNGRVWFLGPFLPSGRYALSSHNGELVLGLPEGQDAQVRVNTFQGEVQSELTGLTVPDRPNSRNFTFTMGEGGSEVDLESFNGLIQLLKLSDVEAKLRRIDARILMQRDARRVAPRAPRAPRPPRVEVKPKQAPEVPEVPEDPEDR